MLDPSYGAGVEEVLDQIEKDDSRRALWNAIVNALNLICDEPDNPLAHRFAIRDPHGKTVWRVPIHAAGEDQDWSVLWEPSGPDSLIHYVGEWPPPS